MSSSRSSSRGLGGAASEAAEGSVPLREPVIEVAWHQKGAGVGAIRDPQEQEEANSSGIDGKTVQEEDETATPRRQEEEGARGLLMGAAAQYLLPP